MEAKERKSGWPRMTGAVCFGAMLVMLLECFLVPEQAVAHREIYELHFAGRTLHGSGDNPAVLPLKKELMRRYPGVDVSQLRLRRIILMAGPAKGRGLVQLIVGRERSPVYRIEGGGRSRGAGRPAFGAVEIVNPFRQSWGPWQLILNGDVSVHKVVLEVESRHERRHGRSGHPLARADGHVVCREGVRRPDDPFHSRQRPESVLDSHLERVRMRLIPPLHQPTNQSMRMLPEKETLTEEKHENYCFDPGRLPGPADDIVRQC